MKNELIDPNLVNLKSPIIVTSILRMFDDSIYCLADRLDSDCPFTTSAFQEHNIVTISIFLHHGTVDRENICPVQITAKPLTQDKLQQMCTAWHHRESDRTIRVDQPDAGD